MELIEKYYFDPFQYLIWKGGAYKYKLEDEIREQISNSQLPLSVLYPQCQSLGKKIFNNFFVRNFIKITHENLNNCIQYIGIRSYGIHLDITHFHVLEPKIFKDLKIYSLQGKMSEIDRLKVLELMTWIKTIRLCIEKSIKVIEDELEKYSYKYEYSRS